MKEIVQRLLASLARAIVKKYRPTIIGITGSVGKTSAKEAVAAVLMQKFRVRKTIGNYNNEFGVPLTIIGATSPGSNPIGWLRVFTIALSYIIFPRTYPEVLVLEMGIDHPGDMDVLTGIAMPHIAMVTAIGEDPVHVEFFKGVEHLAQEKLSIFKPQTVNDWSILNIDDRFSREYIEQAKGVKRPRFLTIGVEREADIQAFDVEYATDPHAVASQQSVASGSAGLRFKLKSEGNIVPVFLPGVLGMPPVYAVLFAAAVARIFEMNLIQVGEGLQHYIPAKGRMNVISGQAGSVLIDDSYNSSPAAVREALNVLHNLHITGRKIICLGNMAELGNQSKRAHTLIGKRIAELTGFDEVVLVGDKAVGIGEAAIANGLPEEAVHYFDTSDQAAEYIDGTLHSGDTVLIKGSQSSRMEKITKQLMADAEQAEELLVRQYGQWLKS